MDLAPWTFNGILSTTKGPNGNQVGATGMFLALGGELPPLMFRALLAFQGQAGLWYVDPLKAPETLCRIDDYIAITAAGYSFARDTQLRLMQHGGFLSEDGDYSPSRWFGRYPGFVAHCYYAAAQKPGAFLQFAWAVSIVIAALKPASSQDGWMQSGLMVLKYDRDALRSTLCDLAVSFWRYRKPKPLYQICADYIGTDEHPLVEQWKLVGDT